MALREEILKPIKAELDDFALQYEGVACSGIRLLDDMVLHIAKTKGKQLRPILVLLVSGAYGRITNKSIKAALAMEMLHVTSLIHDDVVDESLLRRGKQTLNSIWGNKLAVLVGDYLYARVLNILVEIDDKEILKTISDVARLMGEGELLQQQNAREYNLTENNYYEVIRKKTAVLFSACTKIGAIVGGATAAEMEQMQEFGECLGIAFQIQDDILDYSKTLDTGKTYGNDIREQKITLPLICALQNANETQQNEIKEIYVKETLQQEEVDKVIQMVADLGGIQKAQDAIDSYMNKACALLEKLQDSEYKKSLLLLVEEIATRKK
ncbi:MAG: polyprenyl synthetase family protein [Bacteroidales bacterium]|nr:polyprenyl synthetase family protein [Bacteroidales bacterium]